MAVFILDANSLTAVQGTSFRDENLRERRDLQRLVKGNIGCLEEGLMVLAEEYGNWVDSSRRIDLLCLDRDANLVVVELKRTGDGSHMELQAIRYAAMVSSMTFDQAADALAQDRARHGTGPADHEAARRAILEFLGWSEPREEDFATDVRIILVEEDFGKELTTSVLWLRDRDIDIRCIRMKPYRIEDGRLLVDIQQLIPLPEAAEFQTQIGAKRQAERKELRERDLLRYQFWEGLLERAKQKTRIHATRTPGYSPWLLGGIGRAGMSIGYGIRKFDNSVFLWISNSKPAFDDLLAEKDAIEAEFGSALSWIESEGQLGRSIEFRQPGGYRSDRAEWPAIQDRMIDAIVRLDTALRPRIAKIPL
ncbi:DUF4268 domain-containing protein [Thermaurantiacus tibetensis]|uniref:DUF4268 domain-containing protein n=1 Tax=Thermaurantiacus tibetensis TaxID=2759035 RepID=UPI0018908D62|nr:DUF4268 domain-containing protein [Thermaurantiacus tibetensis]